MMADMVDASAQNPKSVLPEDAILVPTEGMSLEQLYAVGDSLTAALIPLVNEWRVANGLPLLEDTPPPAS